MSKHSNITIVVGESGAIYYGTKKGQNALKQVAFTTNRNVVDKLGNAVILCVGTSKTYVENDSVEQASKKDYKE